jgi:hypothetical protein
MRDSIFAYSPTTAAQNMIDGLVDALIATLTTPVKRREPSRLSALGHQFTRPGSGVTIAAMPSVMGFNARLKRMEETIEESGGGIIVWDGQDDLGNRQFAGGMTISADTGELGGAPATAFVRREARRAALTTVGFGVN